ncbi:hypothetical protein EDD17DRAFT_908122 [Pisolithus thermaeus]|nr:hypothetical protein EDD17DRAFT_908122 [Pisolithus thermaeus]
MWTSCTTSVDTKLAIVRSDTTTGEMSESRHNIRRIQIINHAIVVVGRTGVGVSSLVNLLAGCPVSRRSPDDIWHTTGPGASHVNRRENVSVYEIPGFGRNIRDDTLIRSVRSLHAHRGIDLVLYCIRPVGETLMPQAFRLLRQNPQGVPFVAVVTGLEQPGMMEKWWSTPSEEGKPTNEFMLKELGMTFQDYVCVTTLPEARRVQRYRVPLDSLEDSWRGSCRRRAVIWTIDWGCRYGVYPLITASLVRYFPIVIK